MGDVLFGSEKSGTPIETRGGTEQIGKQLSTSVAGGDFDAFSRSRSEAIMNILGFDPAMLNLGDVASRSLADPGDRTAGLFRSLEPIEARTVDRGVEDLRQGFSALGGRFSRNAADAEIDLRGRFAEEFGRNREGAILQAQGQQNQALSSLFSALLGGSQVGQEGINALLSFFQPGQPNFQEGVAGDILAAGGQFAGTRGG